MYQLWKQEVHTKLTDAGIVYVYSCQGCIQTWGQRGQNENFQNLVGGGNGMRVSKQFRGFPKV